MKRDRLLALLAIGVLALAACGPAATPTPSQPVTTPTATPVPPPTPAPTAAGPKRGGTMYLAPGISTQVWDTISVTDERAHGAVDFIYNRLAQRNPGPSTCDIYPLIPTLAQSWKWIDSTTLEVKVRPGIHFHNRQPVNGRELIADDVLYSMLTLGKKAGLGILDVPKAVERGEVVDKYTLRLYLKQPNAGLPERITHDRANIYAKEAVGDDLAVTVPEEHVGTGPFMFKSQKAGVDVVLERNPDYWEKGLPYLDQMHFRIVPDSSTRVALFRSGQLDLLIREPIPSAKPLSQLPDVVAQKCATLPTYPLGIRSDMPPFNDVRLRRAVSMAIDRQAIVDSVYQGDATTVYSPVPHMSHPSYMKLEDYSPEARKYLEYHPDESKRLLAEAGYPNGLETTVSFRSDYPYDPRVAEALSAMLPKVGIRVNLNPIDPGAWNKKRTEGIEGITILIVGPEPPYYPLNRHYWGPQAVSPHWTLVGYKNEAKDRLIQEALADETQLDRVLKELQVIIAQDMFNVPMPSVHEFFLARPYVKNVYFKVFYLYNISEYLYRAWLDK